jgi:uncharacterized protein YjbJ (UPF0337 family)
MKSSNQNKVEGASHQVKGRIKKVAGKVVGNRDLEAEGGVESKAGKLQGMIGRTKKAVKQ